MIFFVINFRHQNVAALDYEGITEIPAIAQLMVHIAQLLHNYSTINAMVHTAQLLMVAIALY